MNLKIHLSINRKETNIAKFLGQP